MCPPLTCNHDWFLIDYKQIIMIGNSQGFDTKSRNLTLIRNMINNGKIIVIFFKLKIEIQGNTCSGFGKICDLFASRKLLRKIDFPS